MPHVSWPHSHGAVVDSWRVMTTQPYHPRLAYLCCTHLLPHSHTTCAQRSGFGVEAVCHTFKHAPHQALHRPHPRVFVLHPPANVRSVRESGETTPCMMTGVTRMTGVSRSVYLFCTYLPSVQGFNPGVQGFRLSALGLVLHPLAKGSGVCAQRSGFWVEALWPCHATNQRLHRGSSHLFCTHPPT